jgi:hypothetical protein
MSFARPSSAENIASCYTINCRNNIDLNHLSSSSQRMVPCHPSLSHPSYHHHHAIPLTTLSSMTSSSSVAMSGTTSEPKTVVGSSSPTLSSLPSSSLSSLTLTLPSLIPSSTTNTISIGGHWRLSESTNSQSCPIPNCVSGSSSSTHASGGGGNGASCDVDHQRWRAEEEKQQRYIWSWSTKPTLQQPQYRDQNKLRDALTKIRSLPPLVDRKEVDELKRQLAECARGERFLLQGSPPHFIGIERAVVT